MFDRLRHNLVTRRYQVAGSSALAVVASAFPAFAEGPTTGASTMSTLLGSFTEVAAWMWKEIGLLLTWILGQPILYFPCPCSLSARLFPFSFAFSILSKVRCNV